jgi:hypothetical protein
MQFVWRYSKDRVHERSSLRPWIFHALAVPCGHGTYVVIDASR